MQLTILQPQAGPALLPAHALCLGTRVGDPDHAHAAAALFFQQLFHCLNGLFIQCRGGFIQQQNFGAAQQGPQQGKALALTCGKLRHWRLQGLRAQTQSPRQCGQLLPGCCVEVRSKILAPPGGFCCQIHDLRAPLGACETVAWLALQPDLAKAGVQIGNQAQQDRFARPRCAHEHDALARSQLKIKWAAVRSIRQTLQLLQAQQWGLLRGGRHDWASVVR